MPKPGEEHQEEVSGLESFEENNMFNVENFGLDKEEEVDQEFIDSFPDYSKDELPVVKEEIDKNDDDDDLKFDEDGNVIQPAKVEEVDNPKLDENGNVIEEDEDLNKDFNFDGVKKDEEEKKDDLDLESFNKKFSQNFKSEKELKDFLKGTEDTKETETEDLELSQAENQLAILEPILELDANGSYKIDDEALMRRQFETIAFQQKKDLNDEDVQIEIEEQVQDLIDKGVLDIKAEHLRGQLNKAVETYKGQKSTIVNKREEAKKAEQKLSNEKLQNEFVSFYNDGKFYGVDIDRKIVEDTYKKVASGEFIKSLQTDNKAIVELALLAATKENIFKKSTGLTYNDGMKAIVGEFKTNKKKSGDRIIEAQKRGTASSAEGSKGLINDILYSKPKEEDKK